MKISGLTIAVCSWFLLVARVPAQAPPPPAASLTANPVFQKYCAKCHGKTAAGRRFGGPSLTSDKAGSTDDLRNIISSGKGHMPKYGGKLSSEEIDTLVQQIKLLNQK